MKKLFLSFFFFLSSFFFLAVLPAEVAAVASSEYTIEDFSSEITVNQDTSLTVEERISVYFSVPKHGIFRVIPVIYNSGGRTIRANLKVVSITDEMGKDYHYGESRYRQSINLKIGDSQETIIGPHTYVIKYTISEVLLPYEDHDEVYWNVTGHEWLFPPLPRLLKLPALTGLLAVRKNNAWVILIIRRQFLPQVFLLTRAMILLLWLP
jgi:hypothetical protein